MKDITDIRIDFDDSIGGTYTRNKNVLEDIRFAKIPGAQWAGTDLTQFENKPKPENNKIAQQINRILGQYQRLEMNAKIIAGSDDASEEDASILQGRWRNDFNMSDGIEAVQNAADEAFHGGYGAFKLRAQYDDPENPREDYQHLTLEPIYSAASCCFFSAGALRKDKTDSTQGWHLIRTNRKEVEAKYGQSIANFNGALDFFDWAPDKNKDVYICHYYEIVETKQTVYDFGTLKITREGRTYYDDTRQKIDYEEAKSLIDNNEHEKSTKTVKQVEYALIDGSRFLEGPRKTPFKNVPIVPQYGYHSVINGIEYFCGEVARQRDNQRFLNMGFGAMIQILAEDQISKPEYLPEQIQKFKAMHARKAIDSYSYLLSDPVRDKDGNITHVGPIGRHEPPQLGTGMAAALEMLNRNITEQGGTGQSTLPANVSAEAIQQVNERQDDSYQPLFQNAMQSLKSACEIWIPAGQKLYFSNERKLRLMEADGSNSTVSTLQYDMDQNTQTYGPFKNSARGRYDVTVKAGETHKATKEAEKSDAIEILQYADPASAMGKMAMMTAITATTGEGTEDMRRLARLQQMIIMIQSGLDPKPKNEDEKMMMQSIIRKMQGQQQEQDPNMVFAMAEEKKAEVKKFEAATKRFKVGLEAEKMGADIQKIAAETQGKHIENAGKVTELAYPRLV